MANSPRYTRGAARRRRKQQTNWSALLVIAIAAVFLYARYMLAEEKHERLVRQHHSEVLKVVGNEHLDAEIVDYEGMTISFNPSLHIPNWVSWELTADEITGPQVRTNKFLNDERVKGCPYPEDYTNSGYDRGHMAPAGDMKWSENAMYESFYLTNIVPQAGVLNRGAWKTVEEKCRSRMAEAGDSAIYIICGPVPNEQPLTFIGQSQVAVPRRLFKVICAPYAKKPYAIGFIMDNNQFDGGAQKTTLTVDQVEEITGYDFFSTLPDELENLIESKANFTQWSRMQ